MPKICLLHIGTTKTGTTSLQHSLDLNRKILYAAGYEMLSNKLRKGNSDYLLALSQSKRNSDSDIENVYRKFISKSKSNIIITSEQFSTIGCIDKYFFKRTFDFISSCDLEIKVILYVRNQKNWILSDYIQDVKGGGTYSLEQFVKISLEKEPDKYDLYKLICSLRNLGVNLVVRPYLTDTLKKSDMAYSFYKNIPNFNSPLRKLVKRIKNKNSLRPSKSAIDEIIIFNKLFRSKFDEKIDANSKLQKAFKKVVFAISEIYESKEPLQLSKDLEKQIEVIYREGNNELFNEFENLKQILKI